MTRTKIIAALLTAVVLLIIIFSGCDELVTEVIQETVLRYPIADFSVSPIGGCSGQTVTFTNKSTPDGAIVTSIWYFGDGSDSVVLDKNANTTHIFDSSGWFECTLKVIDTFGEIGRLIKNNCVIIDKAVANFRLSDTTGCVPLQAKFFDESSPNVSYWVWYFDATDSTDTSTYQSPTHTYNDTGLYTVGQIVYDTTCNQVDTMWRTIDVWDCPEPDFMADVTEGCSPLTVRFTNTTSVGTYDTLFWDYGDGVIDTATPPWDTTHVFVTADTFTVTLTATGHEGSGEIIKEDFIVAYPSPDVTFSYLPASPSANDAVDFEVNEADTLTETYFWDFGDAAVTNDTASGLQVSWTYTEAADYTVRLTATLDSNGCPQTVTEVVTVTAK